MGPPPPAREHGDSRGVRAGGLRGPRLADALRWAAPLTAIAVAAAILARSTHVPRPEVLVTAATLDLTLTAPALAWLTLVRAGRLRPIALLPILALGLALATWLVPPEHDAALVAVRALAVPLELALVAWLVVTLRRTRRVERGAGWPGGGGDFADRLRRSAQRLVGSRLAAGVLTTEIAVLRWALVGAGDDPRPHATLADRAGTGPVHAGLALLLLVETIPVHLLLALASPVAAWVATGLSVYALLWLLGDHRALRGRGVRFGARRTHVRLGLRWELDVPHRALVAAEPVARGERPPPGACVLSALGPPNVRLRCRRAVPLRGAYGLRRRAGEIWLRVDEPAAFLAGLRRAAAR